MENNMKTKVGIVGLCGQSIFMRINHFHKPEETLHASDVHQEVGGKGYNQAVAVKRLGGEPYFLSAVGNNRWIQDVVNQYTAQSGINVNLADDLVGGLDEEVVIGIAEIGIGQFVVVHPYIIATAMSAISGSKI